MKKIIAALVAATVIATASVGVSTTAEAHDHGFGIAAGIIGGLAVGSIIASQNRYDDGYYGHHYVVYDQYCHRVRVIDDYGNVYWRRICH